MEEAQKLSEVLNKYDSKNILHGHVMSIIQNDIELELFSDKRHSKNRFCSFTVTAGDGSQAFKDWVLILLWVIAYELWMKLSEFLEIKSEINHWSASVENSTKALYRID